MIYLTKGQPFFEDIGVVVCDPTGYYDDGASVLCAPYFNPEEPSSRYEAKYIAYGPMVYNISDPEELLKQVMEIDPKTLFGKDSKEVALNKIADGIVIQDTNNNGEAVLGAEINTPATEGATTTPPEIILPLTDTSTTTPAGGTSTTTPDIIIPTGIASSTASSTPPTDTSTTTPSGDTSTTTPEIIIPTGIASSTASSTPPGGTSTTTSPADTSTDTSSTTPTVDSTPASNASSTKKSSSKKVDTSTTATSTQEEVTADSPLEMIADAFSSLIK